jgi:peptide/nickel transport system substrate-binding protein
VKFNFDFQKQYNPGRGIQVYMSNVEKIRVLGPHTIKMTLKRPDALFLSKFISGPTAGWVMGAPKQMKKLGWAEFLRHPVGTGPYMVEGEVKDQTEVSQGEPYATLLANPVYWKKGYPRIRKVEFVNYHPTQSVQAVIDGHIDLVTSLIPKDVWKVEKSSNSKVIKGENDPTYTVGFLNLRTDPTGPLHDIRVRKALNYAINKKELMRYAFKGNAVEMRGVLTEKSGVNLSETVQYSWNVPKARELLQGAGYEEGFNMKVFYQEKNYLTARFLQRFYSLLKINVEITPVDLEWIVKHVVYPNTRKGYSWTDEDWGMIVFSNPGHVPEIMGGMLEWIFHFSAPWGTISDSLMKPLDTMYHQVLKTNDRWKRYEIYKNANDYIADQAFWVFTMAPLSLYGVNAEMEFVPQLSQYLYLEYSSVTETHWSLRGKND